MGKNEVVATVYDHTQKQIARIALNGYNINAGGPLGHAGAMRSFRVLNGEGDLWDHWQIQTTFVVTSEDGRTSEAKVAAYPAEANGFGFIEFI